MTNLPKPPDSDATPVEPAIRRSSAKHALGLVACPECNGTGRVKIADCDTVCTWCEGGKMVSHFTVAQWELARGGKQETLDYSGLADTQPGSKP